MRSGRPSDGHATSTVADTGLAVDHRIVVLASDVGAQPLERYDRTGLIPRGPRTARSGQEENPPLGGEGP
jgi:hypothetical protein